MTTEVGVIVLTSLVKSSDVAVSPSALAVSLGVVGIQVVTAGESTVASRNPADMGLLFGVALHVSLKVLLTLEASLAAGLLALELHLFDNSGQIFQAQVGAN